MKKTLLARLMAVVTAFVVAFAGVSASAGTVDTSDKKTASESSKDKCKKKKGKEKKKCKKQQQPDEPSEPEEPEEPDTEEPEAPSGFVEGRVVELTYAGPAIGSSDTAAINLFGVLFPVNFIPEAGEVLATIEIVDDASPNTEVNFSSDTDGDGLNDTGFAVCGSTPDPVEMVPGQQYNVFPYLLPSTGCSDGVATSGTIIVTFNKV